METLTRLTDVTIPQDDYKVTVRFNEAKLEELGIVRLKGRQHDIRLEFICASYIQVIDLKDGVGAHKLPSSYPRGYYEVTNSLLLAELHSQGNLSDAESDSYRLFSHYRIILDQVVIDVVISNRPLFLM